MNIPGLFTNYAEVAKADQGWYRRQEAMKPAERVRAPPFIEHYYRALFLSGNKKTSDGRTYVGNPDDYVSNFHSQLSKSIRENIEDGVWPVCRELHAKGYYTTASCQSHSRNGLRFVVMAFTSYGERKKFIRHLRHLPLIYGGTAMVISHSGGPLHDFFCKAITDSEPAPELSRDILNVMFLADHKEYWMLQIGICGLPWLRDSDVPRVQAHIDNFRSRNPKALRMNYGKGLGRKSLRGRFLSMLKPVMCEPATRMLTWWIKNRLPHRSEL